MTGNQTRKTFLEFFISKNHQSVKSSSLIPASDPTLFFTNAGMVQFKNYFTGQDQAPFSRATSSQKCMRVSGKHNDLENVGRTARHHTFFEMLGNFSFGHYFKKEAIALAWEFLTEVVKLPKDRLMITVFTEDDEAFNIWRDDIRVPVDRIVRMGEKDNFWSMGPTGPCGPCSEIHYDQQIPCTLNNPDCAFGKCDCDRVIEIWNLVFMQFERQSDGAMVPLPKPSIDTGMGLERLAAVLQNKKSNYDSDLFTPIISAIEQITQKKYGGGDPDDTSIRVIADHIRATVFLIADGVLPSNDGRGYVLRRIMRRAIRHGKLLGQSGPFFYKLVPCVVTEMAGAYPELAANQKTIEKVTHAEEERFFDTLEKGLKLLSTEIDTLKNSKNPVLPGAIVFKLYDTYGFPVDLTEIIAAENKMTVDMPGFEKNMLEQKERARSGWAGTGEKTTADCYFDLKESRQCVFTGYETLEGQSTVRALIKDGRAVESVETGDFELICDQTPFYAESGGQTGDTGTINNNGFQALVTNTQKPLPDVITHMATVKTGTVRVGDSITLLVSGERRNAIKRNHTATHIMHSALRKTLGTHVRQAGSYVDDTILRFDFSHFEAILENTLKEIENQVNQVVLANHAVIKAEMDYEDALKKGALAFFGDKYARTVRVITVGDYSTELCGGTHIDHTSEIGFFKILSEGSIAAGIRRIEALTGLAAIKQSQKDADIIRLVSSSLKVQPDELADKVEGLKKKIKTLEKENIKLTGEMMQKGSADLLKDTCEINGVKVALYHADNPDTVRDVALTMRDKIKSGIAVVTAADDNKAVIVVAVTGDLVIKYPANKILSPLATLINGRGGGKPDMAQAGGNNPSGISGIKDSLKEIL
ncbi:MAG: alanine--tRNA ligase [Deltaproteobacteria bacterium]|nr:alanine--tRNA ligase [Deltaproteobacteria bacterium]